jgi:hypothetical protein
MDKNAYVAVHMWVAYHFGKPQHCENCLTTAKRMYHWANISGTYRRERSDWLRLCVPCHKKHDIKALGGKIKARPIKVQPSKICIVCHNEYFKNPKLSRTQWDNKTCCSRECGAKQTGIARLGVTQSAETKAIKSKLLAERWANNTEWRQHVTNKMQGNLYAYKTATKQPRRKALQAKIDLKLKSQLN